MTDKLKMAFLLVAGLFVSVGIAQDDANGEEAMNGADQAEVMVSEHDEYGPYLTDAEGNALYLFVNEEAEAGADRVTEGVRENAAPCTEGCLQNWPALQGEPTAGEGVDEELLYTAEVDGRTQVVYNGWPLYTFANDAEPGDVTGQGVGGPPNVWYLVTPEGQHVESPAEGMDGDAAEDAQDNGAAGAEGDDANGDEGDVGAEGDDANGDEGDVGAEDDMDGAEGDDANGDVGDEGDEMSDDDGAAGAEGDDANGDEGDVGGDDGDVQD